MRATYRVYRIMEMHGWQDVEADGPLEAVAKCFDSDATEYKLPELPPVVEGYELDGYGMGDTFYVYTKDGEPIKPQPTFVITDNTIRLNT